MTEPAPPSDEAVLPQLSDGAFPSSPQIPRKFLGLAVWPPPLKDPRLDKRTGQLAAIINVFVLVFILLLAKFQTGVTWLSLELAVGGQVLAIVLYIAIPHRGRIRYIASQIIPWIHSEATTVLTRETNGDAREQFVDIPRHGLLWVPASINFATLAWVVYVTGGPLISPFASVPLVMLLTGQIVVDPGEIAVIRNSDGLKLVLMVFRHYWFSLLFASATYLALYLAAAYAPADNIGSPPLWEHAAVLAISVFVATLVTMIAHQRKVKLRPIAEPEDEAP